MLKKRVIPVLLYRDGMLVKGEGFQSWRRVGAAMQAVRIHDRRNVDELIFLDIGRRCDVEHIRRLADHCYMPLTVGGGVRTLDDFRRLLAAGADKVSVCTAALDDPSLITRAARKFGSQCVTVSIDVLRGEVVAECGTVPTGRDPVEWAEECADRGAGEILLNAVDRDGKMVGYDLELIGRVSAAVLVPVIACGGCSGWADMVEAFDAGADACAAGALFQFSGETPAGACARLKEAGVPVRA